MGMNSIILPTYTLFLREMKLFIRQKNRMIGALLQPLIFWIIIGSGLNSSFKPASIVGTNYSDFFFTGIVLMVIMFTSIFSTISVIEDKERGFMKGVLVAPVSRYSIVLGKVLGGSFLGLIHGGLFLLLLFTPLINMPLSILGFLCLVLIIITLGSLLTSIGMCIAWNTDSIQGYHAFMSVLLFPLWIFSGAIFPINGTPPWLFWIMKINPLTHGLELLRQCFMISTDTVAKIASQEITSLFYLGICCILTFALAARSVCKPMS